MKFLKTYEARSSQSIIDQDIIFFQKLISTIEESSIVSDYQKDQLDRYFGYENFYDTIKNYVESTFKVFSKYRFDDVEDRLCEFFDEIPMLKSFVKFTISSEKSSHFINPERINDEEYIFSAVTEYMRNIYYFISGLIKGNGVSGIRPNIKKHYIDEYMKKHLPAFYISFGSFDNDDNTISKNYNLVLLERLADRVVIRFKQLYDVVDVYFDYHRNDRRYDPMEMYVGNYEFKICIK